MAIKFKTISDEDVKTIRAARKALTRIAKKLRKLNTAADEALSDPSKDYTMAVTANRRMLDEVEALGIASLNDYMLSIRLLPSGDAAEPIKL